MTTLTSPPAVHTSAPTEPKRERGRKERHWLTKILKIVVLVVFLGPMLIAVLNAFRFNSDIFKYGGTFTWRTVVPFPATLENFVNAWQLPAFPLQLLNSIVLAVTQSTATVVLALLAAFALARLKFRFRGVIFYGILATMFLPFEALAAPMFLVVRGLGQVDTFWGLFLPWIAAPIAIFTLRQAISDIPTSFDEAVMLDGGGLRHIFQHVILPNVWPAMVTVWLTTFIYVWDSFLWPLIVVHDPTKQLAQVGIINLINPNRIDYGTLFAASLMATAPVVILFLILQRFYREGSVSSGLK